MRKDQVSVARAPLREALANLFADPCDKAFFFELDDVLFPGGLVVASDETLVGLVALLAKLECASGGAVAILSDEPIDAMDRILAPLRLAGCGLGGLEIRCRTDGPGIKRRVAADLDPVRKMLVTALVSDQGVVVVDQGLALMLRHEGDPGKAAAAKAFALDALALAPAAFRVVTGELTTRITFAGVTTGSAIGEIMTSDGFRDRTPVVFRSARTGCDGLPVVHLFGGITVAVGLPPPEDKADIVLDGPRDVEWVVREFIAHFDAEHRAVSAGDVPQRGAAGRSLRP